MPPMPLMLVLAVIPVVQWLQSSLRAKLLAAFLMVIAVGAVTSFIVIGLVAPRFFADHMAQMMGPGGIADGMQASADTLQSAFQASVTQAVLVATGVSILVAVLASILISERIAARVRRIAGATSRIAAGHYAERIAVDSAGSQDEMGQLTGSFNEMASSLEATERRRVELLGDVAHELRTPISTLDGYLEGLLDGMVPPSQETWVSLRDETGRLRRLTDDLRDLSRAEARQLSLKLKDEDPASIARAAVDRLQADFSEEGLQLTTNIADNLPRVEADSDRLLQVLTNLLTNAIRYTPSPGTVSLSVGRAPGSGSKEVLFRVADTGIGVTPDDLPHLFDRFYRVDKSRSRAAGGSGVGLTIAKALVEAMGGRIWAESQGSGRGSTFSFTLPAAR